MIPSLAIKTEQLSAHSCTASAANDVKTRSVSAAFRQLVDFWHAPAVIAPNNFVYKSLSNWAFNVAVGCSHACRFCYVPSAATIKQGESSPNMASKTRTQSG